MHNKMIGLTGAALLSMIAAGSASAAGATDCLHAERQVQDALAQNSNAANASNADQARKEAHYGREFCGQGFYSQGVAHYQLAMKLLGGTPKG